MQEFGQRLGDNGIAKVSGGRREAEFHARICGARLSEAANHSWSKGYNIKGTTLHALTVFYVDWRAPRKYSTDSLPKSKLGLHIVG